MLDKEKLIIIRGGGDIATGIAHKLSKCGFNVVILEVPEPSVIRRTVSFATAIYEGEVIVENIKAKYIKNIDQVENIIKKRWIPVIIDPEGKYIDILKPDILIDATIAKVNKGIKKEKAPLVIGVGPGFTAGIDVHAVIESHRGHDLGRVIWKGSSHENTGRPGNIKGFSKERVIKAREEGRIKNLKNIGDRVRRNEVIAYINKIPIKCEIHGVLRGLIQNNNHVYKGLKIADIDPRGVKSYCFTISDKARTIGGGVLEAILTLMV